MIKLTLLTKIGIFSVRWIAASKYGDVTATDIADAGDYKIPSVHTVLSSLRRAGIVKAARGKGYSLGRPKENISIYDIIMTLEGPEFLSSDCPFEGGAVCDAAQACPYYGFCTKTFDYIIKEMKALTLDRLPLDERGEPHCLKWIRYKEKSSR